MGFPQIRGTPLGDPNKKDRRILGSMLGSPYLRNYHMLKCLVLHVHMHVCIHMHVDNADIDAHLHEHAYVYAHTRSVCMHVCARICM